MYSDGFEKQVSKQPNDIWAIEYFDELILLTIKDILLFKLNRNV